MPPRVNNFGHAVWYGPDGSNYNDWEIFFYDGATVHQVTDNIYDDQNPDINNNDEIVWVGYDGTRWNLYKATGVSAGVSISQEVSASALLHINNNGEVVWHGTLKGQYEIGRAHV